MGDVSVFHPGDMITTREAWASSGFERLEVDYLLVPFWLLLEADGREILERDFTAGMIIPMHLPARAEPWLQEQGGLPALYETLAAMPNVRLVRGEMECVP